MANIVSKIVPGTLAGVKAGFLDVEAIYAGRFLVYKNIPPIIDSVTAWAGIGIWAAIDEDYKDAVPSVEGHGPWADVGTSWKDTIPGFHGTGFWDDVTESFATSPITESVDAWAGHGTFANVGENWQDVVGAFAGIGTWPAIGDSIKVPVAAFAGIGAFAAVGHNWKDTVAAFAGHGTWAAVTESITTAYGTPSFFNALSRGNRTSLITITTTATIGAGAITDLIDGDLTNEFFWTGAQTLREIKFDFDASAGGSGAKVIMDGIRIIQDGNGRGHGTWQAEGSDDNSSWTTLGSTFILGPTSATSQNIEERFWTNTTPYRYYRLRQTSGQTSGTPFIQELEFSIAAAGDPTRVQSLERGDRTASITVSTTQTPLQSSTTIDNLIDGDFGESATGSVDFPGGGSAHTITFDFGSGRVIDGVCVLQDRTGTWGNVIFEGSNDNSTYTQIGSTATAFLSAIIRDYITGSNSTSYRYYRLRTGTIFATSPWVYEAEFSVKS